MFPVRLSIVTFNLWGAERWPERAPALQRFCEIYRPDVMGVQELTRESRSLLDAALPHHTRVEDDLPGWTTEGNLWWNSDLFELVDHGAEDVGFETDQNRRLFWVRLRLRDRPRTLWAGDIHLTAPDTPEELDEGHSSRVREIKRVIKELHHLVGHDEPGFLVGDFADSLAPLAHLSASGYSSCFAKFGSASATHHAIVRGLPPLDGVLLELRLRLDRGERSGPPSGGFVTSCLRQPDSAIRPLASPRHLRIGIGRTVLSDEKAASGHAWTGRPETVAWGGSLPASGRPQGWVLTCGQA